MLCGPVPRASRQGLALSGSLLLCLSTQETREEARKMGVMPMSVARTVSRHSTWKPGSSKSPISQLGRGRQSGPSPFSTSIVAEGLGTKSCFCAACTPAVGWIAAVGLICSLYLNLPLFLYLLRGDNRFSPLKSHSSYIYGIAGLCNRCLSTCQAVLPLY